MFYYSLVLLAVACKEKYESPVKSTVTDYLVVEGIINSGLGTTNIILSRTTKLNNRKIQYEHGAQVKVEGEDNSSYFLSETSLGHYSVSNLNLNSSRKYRLSIRAGGKVYLSNFIAVRNNPPIDSISWKRENDGVQLYIHTHDPQNNTRYYQWQYTETWEFHSPRRADLKYKITAGQGGPVYSVAYRDSSTYSYDPRLFYCWQSESSSNILIGSSAKLSKDAIYLPLAFIPPASWKLSVLYSINAKQSSLSKEGYEFLERMKKNTESTGSIFDAQPFELNGNMYCVSDPTEPVIGYINICPVQEKRIFINYTKVPNWTYNPYAGCEQLEIKNVSDSIQSMGSGLLPTYVATISPLGSILTFYAAAPDCVDCTLKGTNIKPTFWP